MEEISGGFLKRLSKVESACCICDNLYILTPAHDVVGWGGQVDFNFLAYCKNLLIHEYKGEKYCDKLIFKTLHTMEKEWKSITVPLRYRNGHYGIK